MPAPIVIHANAFVSRWTVKPEARAAFVEQFDALWRPAAALMEEVTNFVYYGWGRNPNEFVAIESWKTEEVTNAMRQSEVFKVKVGNLLALCSAPMVMEMYSPWEGARSVFDLYPPGPSEVHPTSPDGAIGVVFA